MNLDTWQWLLLALGAMFVGMSKTGIAGTGMLFVVLFANAIPAKQASGFALPMMIFADLIAVLTYRAHANWAHIWKLMPWTAAGVVGGYFAMHQIDDGQARLLIGIIILSMAGMQIWRRYATAPGAAYPVWFAPMIGVMAGFTTLIANAAGPLMAIYLLAMGLPKMEFVGTSAVFFMLLNLFKVPFMIALGLISTASIGMNVLMVPAVLAGAYFGRWLLPKINQKLFELSALGMSVLAGIRMLF